MTRSHRAGMRQTGLRRRRSVAALGCACALAGLLAVPGPARGQDETGGIQATLLRTWTPGDVTVVDGLANVPLDILGAGTTGAYRFELAVFDADGKRLYQDGWKRSLSDQASGLIRSGTTLLEPFRFGLKPGSYEVEIRAFPTDAPQLGTSARLPLSGYEGRPAASDLFLAYKVEPLEEDAGGGSWSVTHGGFGIGAAPRAMVLPEQPDLFYYLELYAGEAVQQTVSALVQDAGGRVLYRTPGRQVEVDAGGHPFTGHLSLAGLPPGEYSLVMNIEANGATVSRSAPFEMLAASESPLARGDASEEAGYFASLSDQEIEDRFGAVGMLVTDAERIAYEALPPDAKRRYLTEFFRSHDSDPLTSGNKFLDEYLFRMDIIESRYADGVGTTALKPWLTPRGRILLLNGEPSDRIVELFPADQGAPERVIGSRSFGGEPPYEIWSYGKTTGFVYLFVQEDRFNSWRLIYSTDPDVSTLPDWTQRVGLGALRDLRDHYGIQPRFRTGLDNN